MIKIIVFGTFSSVCSNVICAIKSSVVIIFNFEFMIFS